MPRKTRQTSSKAENGPVVKLPAIRKLPATPATEDDADEEEPVPSSSRSRNLRKDVTKKDLVLSKNLESTSNGSNECNGSGSVSRSDSGTVNVLKRLDLLQYGSKKERSLQIKSVSVIRIVIHH